MRAGDAGVGTAPLARGGHIGPEKELFPNLKDFAGLFVAPVIGIVGAVTGFYFGETYGQSDKEE